MPDWKKLVQERLEPCGSHPTNREEVVAELAAHFEEAYEQARSQGLIEAAATELTLREVTDWRVLSAVIHRAKSEEDPMNHRTRGLWLPALITLFGASVSLTLFQYIGIRPYVAWVGNVAVSFYWAWLATLPLFGALGAYLSQRAQASTPSRLAAGLSPALVMLIVMCLILPWGLAIDGFDFLRLVSFGLGLATWVAIPGVALLLGALPFLGQPKSLARSEA